jgi:uncharacterized protein
MGATATPRRLAAPPLLRWGGASRESTLVRIAIAVIALHVVDDNFLQPQPGTSAGDHVVSGLVPLAVLGLAAWSYRRMRGGGRAAVALVLGVLGVVAGSEAIAYTTRVGAAGDDYTGLLAVPAGLMLVGIGIAASWRTRRRGGSRPRRYLRRALLCVAAAAVAAFVVVPLTVAYITTHIARPVVPADRLGVAHERVSFATSDGLRLSGWYIPSRNRAAVIAFPGRNGPQRPARMLSRHGYGVLLFDRRGEGESQGDPNAWGWGGEKDITAAIAFLQRRPDVDPDRIGGLGLSVGGELMLQTAAETDTLKAVVSEGAGARSIREYREMPGIARAPLSLGLQAAISAGLTVFSDRTPPPPLQDVVGRIAPRPVFLIWATHGVDTEALNPKFYAAAHEPKTLWEIPEAGHTGGIAARPAEYERRVVGFFDEALLR